MTDQDFIQRNGTWLLSVIGLLSACSAGLLTFFLKSRCTEINCGCCSLKRQPVALEANQATIQIQE